mmetsp:Transcript_30360/g.40552  ORF Transcript_30360/g.40552 Transcript_30360/m.40552 type:complete len:540 (+) Transcript_30360:156-1775(+)
MKKKIESVSCPVQATKEDEKGLIQSQRPKNGAKALVEVHKKTDRMKVENKTGLGLIPGNEIDDREDIVTMDGINLLRVMRAEARMSPLKSCSDKVPPEMKDKKAKVRTPKKKIKVSREESTVDLKTVASQCSPSKIICHLSQTQSPSHESHKNSSNMSSIISRLQKRDVNLPLHGLSFVLSGVKPSIAESIINLGGEVIDEVGRHVINRSNVEGKLFFISHATCRRKLKYILAVAHGVPMLHYSWVEELAAQQKGEDPPNPFDSDLFERKRLPVGLSIKTGMFPLQRTKHANKWTPPGYENNGEGVFHGMSLAVVLENKDSEKHWRLILSAAGAKVVGSSALKEKGCHLDAVLVDALSLPPHTTASPARVGAIISLMKKQKDFSSQDSPDLIDLSWALQCLIQRRQISFESEKRFFLSLDKVEHIFSLKVKTGKDLVRYEVGDPVKFGKKQGVSFGRIVRIHIAADKTRKSMLDIQLMEQNSDHELMDGGKTIVTIDESALRGHIVLLSRRDFESVRRGYLQNLEVESSIFMLKKAKGK